MPHKNGLEHEPLFLSLGIAVYRDQLNFFFSIVFKPLDVQCNITVPRLFWVDYLASKILSPSI